MDHLAIVGAGTVGTAVAFSALHRGVAGHVSLYDVDGPRARAEALDLRHGLQFLAPATISGGDDLGSCSGADVVVITAGAKQRPGETRLELAGRNAALMEDLLPSLSRVAPDALLLVVTNPVDVLTQLAAEITGRDDGTVLGSGTVLDSSRLRHLIADRFGIAERHVHAYVVGEHGDSETVLWSSARIGGAPLGEVPTRDGTLLGAAARAEILHQVRGAADEIIAGKGATSWAIGLAATEILDALDRKGRSAVLPVSAPIGPSQALGSVCLSLPRMVDRSGAGRVLPVSADPEELDALHRSAETIRATMEQVRGTG